MVKIMEWYWYLIIVIFVGFIVFLIFGLLSLEGDSGLRRHFMIGGSLGAIIFLLLCILYELHVA